MGDGPGPGVPRRLSGALLTASLMPLNSTMVAVAVPDVAAELGHSRTTVTQALVATYLITAIALQSPGGTLGDRLGPWRVVRFGQLALAAGAVLGLLAPDLVVLTVARMLMAGGGALAVPATLALLRLELPPERRGRAFGVFGAVMGLAAAVGPLVGGALVDVSSWEAVFLVNVPVLALTVLLSAGAPVQAAAAASPGRFDWSGSVLLTAALGLGVVGAESEGTASLALLLAGLLALVAFVRRERRAPNPVVDLRLFASRPFAAGSSLVALQNLVMYAVLFEVPVLLDRLFASSARSTGALLSYLTVAMVVVSLAAGRLVDRYGPRPVALGGVLCGLAGVLLLHRSGLSAAGDVRLPLCLLGAGIGLSTPAAQTASASSVPRAQSGMAAGVGSTLRYTGAVAGIAVLGRVLDLEGDRGQVLADHGVLTSVHVVALLVCLGCAAALPRRVSEAAGVPGR